MFRKIALLIVVSTVCIFTLSSCSKYNAVKEADDTGAYEYNKTLYYESSLFFASYSWMEEGKESGNVKELGWIWYTPLLAQTVFYSDDTENPDFIFNSRTWKHCVYLSENFDFKNNEFIIDGTDISITLSTFCYDKAYYASLSEIRSATSFSAHSKNHSALELYITVYQWNEKHLVQLGRLLSNYYYELTPEAFNSLTEAGLL